MKIVYMGTPDFAVLPLQRLIEAGQHVVAVVTTPDKPAGRGLKLSPSPVKAFAESQGLPVLQPEKLRDETFLAALKSFDADIFIVVAFRMLPEVVWSMPHIGTFNLHASLLPDYRGAAPINWAVMNGETTTGVTTFFIDKQIDTGNILLQATVDIPAEWNAGNLHDALQQRGADLVVETVQLLIQGKIQPSPQNNELAKHHAPKIFKETCQIHWDKPASVIHNQIRGLSPYPAAFTHWEGKVVKIYATQVAEAKPENITAGTVKTSKQNLWVACSDNWLEIKEIQIEGKKKMPVGDFLRGATHLPVVFE